MAWARRPRDDPPGRLLSGGHCEPEGRSNLLYRSISRNLRAVSGLASLHDSAGRPNQRLAFGGPPRTRPDDSLRWIRCWFVRLIGANRPGSDTGADDTPLGSSGGCPARPSTLRSAQSLRQPSPDLGGSAREPAGLGLSLRAPRGEAISYPELNDYATA